jgi:proteasome lid subunit RPN8/RPN11
VSTAVFVMPRAVRRAIVTHARRERPRECCGLILGVWPQAAFAVPMANLAAAGRSRYQIDDAAHVRLRRVLREFVPAVSIIGVYHSHPAGDAVPSPSDIAEAMYPDWAYVIVGLRGGRARVRGFRIRAARVRELSLQEPHPETT